MLSTVNDATPATLTADFDDEMLSESDSMDDDIPLPRHKFRRRCFPKSKRNAAVSGIHRTSYTRNKSPIQAQPLVTQSYEDKDTGNLA